MHKCSAFKVAYVVLLSLFSFLVQLGAKMAMCLSSWRLPLQ